MTIPKDVRVIPQLNLSGLIGDGAHDDTQGLRDALASAIDGKIPLVLPPGTYLFTGTLLVDVANVHVIGAGLNLTILRFRPAQPNTDGLVFDWSGQGSVYAGYGVVSGLTLDGDSANCRYPLSLRNQKWFKISEIAVTGGVAPLALHYLMGLACRESCFRGGSLAGIYCDDQASPSTVLSFRDCDISNNIGDGVRGGGMEMLIDRCTLQSNAGYALRFGADQDWNSDVVLANNHFEWNHLGDIYAGDHNASVINTAIRSHDNTYIGRTDTPPAYCWDFGNVIAYSKRDRIVYPLVVPIVRINRPGTTTVTMEMETDPREPGYTNTLQVSG